MDSCIGKDCNGKVYKWVYSKIKAHILRPLIETYAAIEISETVREFFLVKKFFKISRYLKNNDVTFHFSRISENSTFTRTIYGKRTTDLKYILPDELDKIYVGIKSSDTEIDFGAMISVLSTNDKLRITYISKRDGKDYYVEVI